MSFQLKFYSFPVVYFGNLITLAQTEFKHFFSVLLFVVIKIIFQLNTKTLLIEYTHIHQIITLLGIGTSSTYKPSGHLGRMISLIDCRFNSSFDSDLVQIFQVLV